MKQTDKYGDIIHMPHHVSSKRAPMSMTDRAAQFSPFAALTGLDAAIAETARCTSAPVELTEGEKALVDEKLRQLCAGDESLVEVTWFQPDPYKAGGAYVTVRGEVKQVDGYAQMLILTDGTRIPFAAIVDMDTEV